MRGLVTKDALTDEITRAREQHGDNWQQRLQEQYDGRFYERLQEAWGNEWNTRLDLVLQGNNDTWLIEQIRNESYTLQAGNKRYELSNHLGNVLAVVSDKKEQSDGVTWSAIVLSAQDYFPFGMAMPGRGTDAKHRYGFNGKETDPETGIQDYGLRWYLPNIARFPSVDPLTHDYPWYTPYQFAGNTPIQAIDLDGGEPTFPYEVREAIKTKVIDSKFVIGVTLHYMNKIQIPYQAPTFQYKAGTKGTFSSDAIWRFQQFFILNRDVRKDLGRYAYKNIGEHGLAPYDCITALIQATALLFDIPEDNVPRPNDLHRTVSNWLDVMHKKGMAGNAVTMEFADEAGVIKAATRMPTKSEKKLSDVLVSLSTESGGTENDHVFGVSLMDGLHSIMISLEKDGKFYLHDQSSWGRSIGLTATELEDKILSFYQSNYKAAPGAHNFTLKVSEIKKQEKKENASNN